MNQEIDLEAFYHRLNHSSQKTLLLDYDGTLAPFRIDPHEALPYPGIRKMINRIMESSNTRVVIVSGRWIKDLIPLLRLKRTPEIWGSHGLERLKPDGSYEVVSMEEEALNSLVAADEWIESVGLADRCEKKPGCVALHWRGLGEKRVDEIREMMGPELSLIAEAGGLRLREFDGGLELRVPGRNKGDAVETILEEMGRDGLAAYLGDDLTDEDAFKSIKNRGGGVLVRPELRPTAADVWIRPPEELLEFLSNWLA